MHKKFNGYTVSSLAIGAAAVIVGAIGFAWHVLAVLSDEIDTAKQMQALSGVLAIVALLLFQKGRKPTA